MSIGFEGLQIEAIIGVYEQERSHPQALFLDLLLEYDAREAIRTDREDAALDYTQVAEVLRDTITQGSFGLLETLAYESAQVLFSRFEKIISLELCVRKPGGLPGALNSLVRYQARRYNEVSTD